MAKSSVRARNAGSAENLILKKWNAAAAFIDDYAADSLDELLRLIKKVISDKIYSASMSDSKLSAYDESIYDYYCKLMGCYASAVSVYEENPLEFSDIQIKNIYDGLYSIIVSRLKAFEERPQADGSNPVSIEKREIIAKALKSFDKAFDSVCYKFKMEKQKDVVYHARRLFLQSVDLSNGIELINLMGSCIEKNCFEEFYAIYCNTTERAVTDINDLEKRKSVDHYITMLNEEYQILGAIIKVQAGVLESYLENGIENESTVSIIRQMLYLLREAYQRYGKETADIISRLKAARESKADEGQTSLAQSREQFSESLLSHTSGVSFIKISVFEGFALSLEGRMDDFCKHMEKEIINTLERIVKKNNSIKQYYEIKKVFSHAIVMADEMNGVFKSILDYYNEEDINKALTSSEKAEIITGVAETVAIKIQSIDENKNEFKAESDAYAHVSYSKENDELAISDTQKSEIKNQASQCMGELVLRLAALSRDDRRGSFVIRRMLADIENCDLALEHKEKQKKAYERKIDEVVKKTDGFVKDYVLFEMSTFEEIMNYSVSLLKASEDENVSGFADFIYNKAAELDNILKINGITPIAPVAHDMFNAKEHEVLMAEKNEDYKKGEIIKLMNRGYKSGERVLIRANVIAAR